LDTQNHNESRHFIQPNRKQTVLLFGEVLADIFPEYSVLGGAPFNVARHLKAFSQNPFLITRLGNDSLRDKVLGVMKQNRMETMGVQCDMIHPTGQVQVHIEGGHNRFDILPMQAYDFIHPAVVRMTTFSVNPSMVYFGTMAQRQETSRLALKTLLRNTQAVKFLDVNLRAPWYDVKTVKQSIQYADIVKLNIEELGELAQMFKLPGNDPRGHAQALMDQFNLQQVVITCGEDGAWQINRNGREVEVSIKSPIANLVDTVGAGDGFAAVLILGSLRHWPIATILERANAFAAAICGIRGAVPDHENFYTPFLSDWNV
jgi:fructokinase